MARLRFLVEVESIGDVANAAANLRSCINIGLMAGRCVNFASVNVIVDPYQPDPVDPHGEHGMADGVGGGAVRDDAAALGLVPARPTPLHQPEKRPATCSCYMGASAQPYAHEPSCPVHPRYVDTELSSVDRSPD